MGLNLHQLFLDVFHPEADERVVVVTDVPHGMYADSELWRERREMAADWRASLVALGERVGFDVLPLVTFLAVGRIWLWERIWSNRCDTLPYGLCHSG